MNAANRKKVRENHRQRAARAMADVCLILADREKLNDAIDAYKVFHHAQTNTNKTETPDWLSFLYSDFKPSVHLNTLLPRMIGFLELALDPASLESFTDKLISENMDDNIDVIRQIVILNSACAYVESTYMREDKVINALLADALTDAGLSHNDVKEKLILEEISILKNSELVVTKSGAIAGKYELIGILLNKISAQETARTNNSPIQANQSISTELMRKIIETANSQINEIINLKEKSSQSKPISFWNKSTIMDKVNKVSFLLDIADCRSLSQASEIMDTWLQDYPKINDGRTRKIIEDLDAAIDKNNKPTPKQDR